MNALDRLERLIQGMIERPASLLGPRQVHPLAIAAALTRAMEAGALRLVDRIVVPDRYTVTLSPEDARHLQGVTATLEQEFADYLTRLTGERGLSLNAPPLVQIIAGAGVPNGSPAVSTHISEPPARATRRNRRRDDDNHTQGELVPPSADGGVARLELLSPSGTVTHQHALTAEPLIIGRRSTNGLALDDAEVSRTHARIERDGHGFLVRDLESTNGTLLNGAPLRGPRPLRDGDLVQLGRTRLRFRSGTAPRSP